MTSGKAAASFELLARKKWPRSLWHIKYIMWVRQQCFYVASTSV